MKSSLFSKNDFMRSDEFVKDARVLLDLPAAIIGQLPACAFQALLAPSPKEEESVCGDAAAKLDITRTQLAHAIDVTKFFISEATTGGDAVSDQPQHLAADMVELLKSDPEMQTVLEQYFKGIKKLAEEEADDVVLRRKHLDAGLTRIKKITTLVDYRMVFDRYLEVDEDIDAFTSRCRGVIPMGTIEFRFAKGEPERILFTVDKRTIRLLINRLRALEKQIDIARSYLNLAEDKDDD